jgi:hypothetical protein
MVDLPILIGLVGFFMVELTRLIIGQSLVEAIASQDSPSLSSTG